MTPAELSAIRERLDAATPGNWRRFGVVVSTDLDLPQPLVVEACSEDRTQAENDVEFIANAPTDLRALLDEVERLKGERDAAKAEVAFLKRNYSLETAAKLRAQLATTNAALAERQESATDVVEWRPSDQRVFLDVASLRVVLHTDGLWVWSVYWPVSHRTEQGRVATEEEAKSAAIAAARGMK
jgi:seryl-tRNA synthetase